MGMPCVHVLLLRRIINKMSEPISTGGFITSKFFPPLMGLLGSLITLFAARDAEIAALRAKIV